MAIASCFVGPHMKYKRLKAQHFTKDQALDPNLLDMYVKDVFTSFAIFWVILPNILWKLYVKRE